MPAHRRAPSPQTKIPRMRTTNTRALATRGVLSLRRIGVKVTLRESLGASSALKGVVLMSPSSTESTQATCSSSDTRSGSHPKRSSPLGAPIPASTCMNTSASACGETEEMTSATAGSKTLLFPYHPSRQTRDFTPATRVCLSITSARRLKTA